MKNRKWLALLLTLVLGLSIGLAGCKENGGSGKADSDQYLTTVMFEQRTLDVNDAEDIDSAEILTETMDGLTRVWNDGNGDEVKAAGAESWDISKDGLVYTFHLRDYQWSDGKPVTAQQYVDSWLRLLDPQKGFGYAYFAYDVKNAQKYNAGECKAEEVGVKAIDEKTFEVTLERPTPYFIKKVGFKNLFPIRIDIVNELGEKYGTDYTKIPYCGPYVISEYISNNKIVLTKNPTYWDAENVKMQKITMQQIQEVSTQMQMFDSHQLDITGASQDYLQPYSERAKKGEFVHQTGFYPATDYFSFNVKSGGPSGLFTNKKIRQAFSMILDREDICTNLWKRFVPAYGFCPPTLQIGDKEYRKEVKEPMKDLKSQYDSVEKVGNLFKEGLQELGKDPNGSYEVTFLTSGTSAASKARQEYYQAAFQKLPGIKCNLQVAADTNQFWDLFDALEYDFTLSGWIGDYDDPMTFFDMWVTGGGNNSVKYSSADYDKLMADEIYKTTKNEDRLKIFSDAEKILLEDMPIAPIFYEDTNRFIHNYVKGAQFPLFGPEYELKYVYTDGRN